MIALIAFIAFIVTLGVKMIKADVELVSEDYYKQEVEYGAEITAQKNAKSSKVELKQEISESGILLSLTDANVDEGTLLLRRSNDPTKDIKDQLEGTTIFIEGSRLTKGKYDVIIDWKDDQKFYQLREVIWIP